MGTNSLSKASLDSLTGLVLGLRSCSPGIAYQLVDNDPLVNTTQCQLDASLMQQLGANAIRVYHVDASKDHQGCMNAFAAVGIYLFVDMDSFKTYIRYVRTIPALVKRVCG